MSHSGLLKKCRLRSGSPGCCASPEIPEIAGSTDETAAGANGCKRLGRGSSSNQDRQDQTAPETNPGQQPHSTGK